MKKIRKIFLIIVIGLGLLVYFHNFNNYPATRGLDSHDHIEYIEYLVDKNRIPRADEGLQMYQPPLYYYFSSRIYILGEVAGVDPLKFVQLVGFLSSLGIILLSYEILRVYFKDKFLIYGSLLFVIFLPILVYEANVITSETLFGFLATLAIYLISVWKDKLSGRRSLFLGVIVGASLLTKYTGVFLFASVIVYYVYGYLRDKELKIIRSGVVFVVACLVVCGWFYVRQFILFGNPFILSNDPSLFPYRQYPGYRDIHFYTNLEGILPLNVFGAEGESFWGGTYNCLWVDTHNTFLPIMEFSKAGALVIYLGLLPTYLLVRGFIRAIRLGVKGKRKKYLFLVVYSVVLFGGYVFYTYKLPFGSSIKTFYFLSAVSCWAVFFGLGFEKMLKWSKEAKYLFLGLLVLLVGLIVKLYWYQSWWLNIGE